jgi:hypothetical protein
VEVTLDNLSAMTLEAQRWRLLAASPHSMHWRDFYLTLAEAYEDAANPRILIPTRSRSDDPQV